MKPRRGEPLRVLQTKIRYHLSPVVIRTRHSSFVGAISLAALLAGCGSSDSTELDRHHSELAIPGPWVIPASTLAAGDSQFVPYTGAGPWPGQCGGGFTTGGQILKDYLLTAFPQILSIGGYSCRAIVGNSSQMSVHGTGRALDIMLPLDSGEADNGLGDPIGNFLIENAEAIGIQYMIWDLWTWNASRAAGSKDRGYGGSHPHHDHLHVELSVEASLNTTPWFDGSVGNPTVPACPPIDPTGAVIDELSPCFETFGPNQYWRREVGVGIDGALLWTDAFANSEPSNWARWNMEFAAPGEFVVSVFIDPAFGVYSNTRYEVRHAGQQTIVSVDQSQANGWHALGTFTFAAGSDQWVSVYDNASVPIPDDQHIAVDALDVSPVTPPQMPPPPPPPDPGTPPVEPPPDDPMEGELPIPVSPPPSGPTVPGVGEEPPPKSELGDFRGRNTGGSGCSTKPRSTDTPSSLSLLLVLAAFGRVRRLRR